MNSDSGETHPSPGLQLVWIKSFPSLRQITLLFVGRRLIGIIPLCEIKTALCRFSSRIAESISYEHNRWATSASISIEHLNTKKTKKKKDQKNDKKRQLTFQGILNSFYISSCSWRVLNPLSPVVKEIHWNNDVFHSAVN